MNTTILTNMNRLASVSITTVIMSSFFFTLLLISCTSKAGNNSGKGQMLSDHLMVVEENNSITVTAGKDDLEGMPVAVEWNRDTAPTCMESNGMVVPAQIETIKNGSNLLWMMVEVPAGQSRVYVPSQTANCTSSTFDWENVGTDRSRLIIDGVPAIEYVHPEFDRNRRETLKPFHHVFSPPNGSRFITQGVTGPMNHHRGIFHAYSEIQYEGNTVSNWGGGDASYQEHADFLQTWAGPVFGGHEVLIEWKDEDDEVFIDEIRKVKVFRRPQSGELLIDIESTVTSKLGTVELGGDPNHGGMQFRADILDDDYELFVSENPEDSRYLRSEKWSTYPEDSELTDWTWFVDAPWNAFRFVIDDNQYTVGLLTHPNNPPGGQMSERLYGRFGEWIPDLVIDQGESINLHYRFFIASGNNIDRKVMEREYSSFSITP